MLTKKDIPYYLKNTYATELGFFDKDTKEHLKCRKLTEEEVATFNAVLKEINGGVDGAPATDDEEESPVEESDEEEGGAHARSRRSLPDEDEPIVSNNLTWKTALEPNDFNVEKNTVPDPIVVEVKEDVEATFEIHEKTQGRGQRWHMLESNKTGIFTIINNKDEIASKDGNKYKVIARADKYNDLVSEEVTFNVK